MTITVQSFEKARDVTGALSRDVHARYLGGGTLVMREINEGDVSVTSLIRSTDPSMSRFRTSGSRIELGAAVTMGQILRDASLSFLHDVARSIGGPAIRNMATIGGNLFAPSPYGDFAVALLALNARVQVQSGYSAREMPLSEMLKQRTTQPTIFVTGVVFNRPRHLQSFRFRKVARVRPKGISVLSIATHINESGGRASEVRIAYGAMADTPIRASAVERALEGQRLTEEGIRGALSHAVDECTPATDAIASSEYRLDVLPVHLRRILLNEVVR